MSRSQFKLYKKYYFLMKLFTTLCFALDDLATSAPGTEKRDASTKPQAGRHKPREEDLDQFFGEPKKSSGQQQQQQQSVSDEDDGTLLPHWSTESSDEEEDGGGWREAMGRGGGGDIDLEELLRKKMG